MRKFLLSSVCPKLLLVAALLCGWLIPAYSQQLRFHPAFDSLQSGNSYHLIGQVGRHHLVLYTSSFFETGLLVCDADGNALERKTLPLPAPLLTRYVTASANHFNIIFQKRVDNTNYVQVASFDQRGNLAGPIKMIDSSRYDLLGPGAYYNIGNSANNNFTLLYRLLQGLQKEKLLVSYILFDSNAVAVDSRNFYIPFNADHDTASIMYTDPQGTVVLGIHDRAANYRLGSTIQLYHAAPGKDMKNGKIYLKENKPLQLSFATSAATGKLYLGGLSNNFYKKEIDGVVAVRYDLAKARADTSFYYKLDEDFNKELVKEISGINLKNLKKRLSLSYFDIGNNEQLSFAINLVSVKKVRDNWGNAHTSRGQSQNYNTGTPSQNLDAIRNYSQGTALPANTTAGSRAMNNYIQKMTFLQSQGITSPPAAPSIAPMTSGGSLQRGASEVMSWTLTADPTMMYKTYYFHLDSQSRALAHTWEEHLYFSHAPLITSAVLKINNEVSMIHYVIKRNDKVLEFRPLQRAAIAPQPVGKSSDPIIFFGRRYTMVGNSKLLTLYLDNQLRIGLASLSIEN